MQLALSMNAIEVESVIDIDAPPEAVWRVLTDFASYRDWNPFIVDASADLRVGGLVRLSVHSPLPLRFRARITIFDAPRQLRWIGDFVAPWFGAGEHVFVVAPRGPGKSSFLQREVFSGLIPRLLRPVLVAGARRGFRRMNRALAQAVRAEGAAS